MWWGTVSTRDRTEDPSSDRSDDRGILEAAHRWRTALSMPDVAEDQLDRFNAWIEADARHEAAYDRAVTVYQALGALRDDDLGERLMTPSWRERLPDFLFRKTSGRSAGRARLAAVAAGFAVAVGLLFVLLDDPEPTAPAHSVGIARHSTNTGEIRSLRLADGTAVTMGASTRIVVSITDRKRTIELLSGAAFFDVTPDPERPFTVVAGELTATAVGTQFDVRHNADIARVGVADGQVAVSYPRIIGDRPSSLTATASLLAGQQIAATPSEGLRRVEPVAIDLVGIWQTKRLAYSGATLAELVADARRHGSTVITIHDPDGALDGQRVTAFFDGNDVDAMMATLPDVLPVAVRRTAAGTIEIRPLP